MSSSAALAGAPRDLTSPALRIANLKFHTVPGDRLARLSRLDEAELSALREARRALQPPAAPVAAAPRHTREQRRTAAAARLEAWERDGVEAGGGEERKGAMPPSQLLEEDGPMRWRRQNSGSAAIRLLPDA